MNDFAFVAIIVVCFALLALFVRACDRIIGADEVSSDQSVSDSDERIAA